MVETNVCLGVKMRKIEKAKLPLNDKIHSINMFLLF